MSTEPDNLQFERAEYAQPDQGARQCATCKAPITDVYYEVEGRLVCPICHEGLQRALTGG